MASKKKKAIIRRDERGKFVMVLKPYFKASHDPVRRPEEGLSFDDLIGLSVSDNWSAKGKS